MLFSAIGVATTVFAIFYGVWWTRLFQVVENAENTHLLARWLSISTPMYFGAMLVMLTLYAFLVSRIRSSQEARGHLRNASASFGVGIGAFLVYERFASATLSYFAIEATILYHGRWLLLVWMAGVYAVAFLCKGVERVPPFLPRLSRWLGRQLKGLGELLEDAAERGENSASGP